MDHQRLNQFLSMSSPLMPGANMDGNNAQSFSAMIAALANSPPGLNSPGSVPPPMSSTPIPSPQSAFALLRNSAIAENQKNQSGNFQTVLSPTTSSVPNLTAQNLGMYMDGLSTSSAFHATNAPPMLPSTFGRSVAASLNSHLSPAVNALAPNSPLQHLAQAADAASSNPAQMLFKLCEATKNIDPNLLMALASKNFDQNHLLMALATKIPISTLVNSLPTTQSAPIVPELPISTTNANINANQLSFSPQCLSQALAAHSAFQHQGRNQASGNVNYNIPSPSKNQGSPGKSQSTTSSSTTSADNPPRKIRRRRPKSPAAKTIFTKSPQEKVQGQPSPGEVGASPEQPQLVTSDEPCDPMVNNSPPSLIPHQDASFGQINPPKQRCLSEDDIAEDSSKEICDGSPMDSKKCLVCGDRATGYNFNVITCESCKAFFRRNALRPKEFKCPYEGNCDINTVSRRFCQKCRLQKCLEVGMKKEWILNEDQLKRRKNSRLKGCNQTSPQNISSQLSPGSVTSPISCPRSVCRSNSVLSQIESPRPTSVSSVLKMDFTEINERKLHDHRHSPIKAHSSGVSQMNDVKPNPVLATSMRSSLDLPISNEASSSAFHHVSQNPILIPKSENLGLQQIFGAAQFPGVQALHTADSKLHLSMENIQHLLRIQAAAVPHVLTKQEPSTPCSVPSSEGFATPTANLSHHMPNQVSTPISSEPPTRNIPSTPEITHNDHSATLSKLGSPKAATGQEMTLEQKLKVLKEMDESMERTIRDALDNDIMDYHVDYYPIQDCVFNDTKLNYQLNHDEKMQIDFVLDAFKCFDEPMDQQRAKKLETERLDDPTNIMNLMDVVMRRVVKMTKKMPSFNDLTPDGKFKLLKAAMIAMTTLRGLVTLDMITQSFKSEVIGKANVSCNMFDKLNNPQSDHPQKELFMRLAQVLHKQIREDKTAMSLFALVVLFDHSQKLTVESDKVKGRRHHDAYFQLLRRYLESQHGSEAAAIVATIPETIKTLQKVSENAVGLFMGKVKRNEIEPLPTEFFRTTDAEQSSQDEKGATSATSGEKADK